MEENEGLVVPENKEQEVKPEEPIQQTVQLTPEEEVAYAQGWRPKDQFQGNPDEWRPAKEWRERGEMLQKIRRMSREIDEMKGGYKDLYNLHMKSQREATQQAIERLKAQRREALREDELELADKIEDKIDQLKEQVRTTRQETTQAKNQVQSPAFEDWVARNQWYVNDDELSTYADAVALRLLKKAPDGVIPPEELGPLVETEVRKRFPEKFKRPVAPPSPDSGGSLKGGNGTSSTNKFANVKKSMSADELQIMNNFVKSGLLTEEEYLKDYQSATRG